MRMQNLGGVELQDRIGVLAARIHAATAELVELAAALDADGSWAGIGVRSCAHYLSISIGVDVWTAGEMVRAGHALETLPCLRAAFAEGRLSFDKIRAVVKVATPDDDEMWTSIALHASGAQLARICRSVRLAFAADDPRRATDPLLNRSVRTWWREDGMLELMAVLPHEDGAVVLAALEATAARVACEERRVPSPDQPELAAEHRTRAMLDADAFVRIFDASVVADASEPAVAPTTQVVVHVDADALSGADPDARSHIENGPWLAPEVVRRLSCDADVVTVTERDGLPIDVGRVRRLITPRLRMAMQSRDEGCRFPGCSVPAARTDGHHVRHWYDGGKTNLDNLVSLCRFHHRRHHEGKFRIEPDRSGDFSFTAADGKPILVVDPQPAVGSLDRTGWTDPSLARARDGGAPYRREYAVSVIADQVASNREASARETARRRQADDEQLMRELLAEGRVASGRDTGRSRTPVTLPRAGPKTAP
jgi:Domain of unknown function (DUF222)/HNH endonuclease